MARPPLGTTVPIKRALSVLAQMAAFFVIAFAGLLLRPFHVTHIIAQQGFIRRQYEFDWLLSVGIGYMLFLLIGLLTRRIRTGWLSSTIAFALTVLTLALLTKIGFKDADLRYGPN